jgi:carbon monoxide dehydrogenase subunit G
MDMTGEFRIPVTRQRVWEALNDTDILKQSIPGCETIEKLSDTEFSAKVVARVGPVKANFAGKVTLSDLDPPQGYTISGEGSGGVAGFAKGSAKVHLAEDGGETVLSYTVNSHVGGKLAQIGSRLIDATARKMAADFFNRFRAAVAPETAGGAERGQAGSEQPMARLATEEEPPVAPPTAAAELRLPPYLWISGLVAIIALMLYIFAGHGFGAP